MTRVLSLFGDWPGHQPQDISAWTDDLLDELGFEDVTRTGDIFALDDDLTRYDLIVLGWNNALGAAPLE